MSDSYDVIVIGGGPAGYPAAIRAAQHGLKVACIDDWQNYDGSRSFGGTCLNAGCIPSKALLESSELFHRAHEEFGVHGIKTGGVELDLAAMQKRKAGIVTQLTGGIGQLFKANKVSGMQGRGRFLGDGKVEFTDPDGKQQTLQAKHVILAAGSQPIELKSVPFDGKQVVDSWGALEFDTVPGKLGVIGAGVIGLELGSVWKRLGSEVVILEAMDTFLPMADAQIARDAQRQFKKQGLDIRLGAKVQGAKTGKSGVTLSYEDKDGTHDLKVDKVIVCVGRKPCSAGLLAEGTGVETDERGFVKVDEECRTGVQNTWAVGDLVRGPMLAHKATEEGVMVADLIAGKIAEVNYEVIPSVIYTAPEIAWVGKTEAQAKEAGIDYKVGTFPFAPNGRAKAMEQAAGMVKLIANKRDDSLIGAHVIGPMAGELISELVVAMEFQASIEDLQRTIHAHPTLAEAIHEAALAADGKALHGINK
ncbi:dihydrolipoyl dehydrogenase [Thioalkalivibrio sp. XN279]|uniref:dihydrolipoyl dehydrogenase n=1 Tax=Thioalkalivibrio sp. XN279 TaxID=2714953 RepID=UPI0014084AD8|nr:dihydrolipoyl dehydrogenase [Thioalkalivibrio sp. XN279]NHA14352.1 dihydrolipoyl dehydrogenase [Thioalkalivibrio sp. XN279]